VEWGGAFCYKLGGGREDDDDDDDDGGGGGGGGGGGDGYIWGDGREADSPCLLLIYCSSGYVLYTHFNMVSVLLQERDTG
jgi:hypothetical protein